MARLITSGFEWASATGEIVGTAVDGQAGTSAVEPSTTAPRSGSRAYVWPAGGGGAMYWTFGITAVADRQFYIRAYARIAGSPASDTDIFYAIGTDGISLAKAMVNSSRAVILTTGTGTQIGSAGPIMEVDTWYRIEMRVKQSATANTDEVELRVDGTQVAVDNARNDFAVSMDRIRVGVQNGSSGVTPMYIDDLAVNDNQGSFQNTWPGEGKVLLLLPISDLQRGTWTGGAGGTTNLWNAVNNVHDPLGTATETDLTQIESAVSTNLQSDEYHVNLQTYADAGIASVDTIKVLHPAINHGEDIATGTKTGVLFIQDNPPVGGSTSFTFGGDVGALGTWPSNWRWTMGAPVYDPSVTKSSSPVLGIRKTDGTTRVASVDALGMYVEYVPGATAAPGPIFKRLPAHRFLTMR